LRIENDAGGIALTPFNAQRAAVYQHRFAFQPSASV
jgi:hypothetical protein